MEENDLSVFWFLIVLSNNDSLRIMLSIKILQDWEWTQKLQVLIDIVTLKADLI